MIFSRRLIYTWITLTVLLTIALLFQTFMLWQAQRGDLNHDGEVNVSDLSIMARHYGKKIN